MINSTRKNARTRARARACVCVSAEGGDDGLPGCNCIF